MLEVTGLTKIFPSGTKAVNDLNLSVNSGEILGLLGPNGAGKSTTIRICTTLSGFDDGKVSVAGYDVDEAPEKVRQSIGYVAQDTGVDYFLTGRENLVLQGHLYRMSKKDIQARVDELGTYFGLLDSLDNLVSSYSGGMRRKLDIATALIHRPKVLFLDEPTLGLDTQSRQSLWQYITRLNQELGLTILLTTHYLEEADKLSDRVAIIDAGRIQAIGTPEELKNAISGDALTLEFNEVTPQVGNFANQLKQQNYAKDYSWDGNNLHLYVTNGAGAIPKIMAIAGEQNITVKTLSLSRPTLDDVFIKHTGSSMLSAKEETENPWWEKWAGKGGGKWQKQWQSQQEQAADGSDSASDGGDGSKDKWPQQGEWNQQGSDESGQSGDWPQQNEWSQQTTGEPSENGERQENSDKGEQEWPQQQAAGTAQSISESEHTDWPQTNADEWQKQQGQWQGQQGWNDEGQWDGKKNWQDKGSDKAK